MAAGSAASGAGSEACKKLELTKFGGYDAFQVKTDQERTPDHNEVQVKIVTAGVNFAEIIARMGAYPPIKTTPTVLGYEAAGVISAVGADVEDFAVGDRVIAVHPFELYRTHCTISADFVFKMPAAMTFAEAAAIPVQYVTAHMMLHEQAQMRPGDTVLVHMAAGGVGSAACQILHAVGDVRVIGTASAGKQEHVRSNGCEHPIDYRSEDYVAEVQRITEQKGCDIILDPLGGEDIAKNYSLLAPMGRQVLFGAANFVSGSGTLSGLHAFSTWWKTAKIDPMDLMMSNKSVMGYNLGKLVHDVPKVRAAMQAVLALYESGSVRPHVDAVFSFEEAGAAHRYMVERKNRGKLVLAWDALPSNEVPSSFGQPISSEPSAQGSFVQSIGQ